MLSIISPTLTGLSTFAYTNPVPALTATHLRLFLLFRKPVYGSHGDDLTEVHFHQFSIPLTTKCRITALFSLWKLISTLNTSELSLLKIKCNLNPRNAKQLMLFIPKFFFPMSVTSILRYTKATFTSTRYRNTILSIRRICLF